MRMLYLNVYQEPTVIPSRKKKVPEVGVSEEGICCKIGLPVKLHLNEDVGHTILTVRQTR